MQLTSFEVFISTIIFIGIAAPTFGQSNQEPATSQAYRCKLSTGELGECVNIRSCPSILNQLTIKKKDPEFARYVKALNVLCGKVREHVCCPKVTSGEQGPRSLLTEEEGCGRRTLFSKFKGIVGGKKARKGAWPFIALLGYDDGSSSPFKCGGTLITARHILTAAHCIRDDLTFVRLGEYDLSIETEARHVDINIVKAVAHPEYNRRNGRSDIAMLYLEHNVEFTNYIKPICLPNSPILRAKSFVDRTPYVIGWGRTQEGGSTSDILNDLKIKVFDNSVCQSSYAKLNRNFTEDQFDKAVICAGELEGGKDSCQGDSGGPLVTHEDFDGGSRLYLIGVVAYGYGCGRPDAPSVYTSTQYFMDWIIDKVQDSP
ncbi:hypothetical protein KR044_010130 [Drosophila immigrans]|nr:hypothetical protein KR044_010130 [Drosophila immigrans]